MKIADLEEAICDCGAGHGSIEGHTRACAWRDRERAAQAARAAYADFCGDEGLVPWEQSKTQDAWLVIVQAVIDEIELV